MQIARYSDDYETSHHWPRHRCRCRIVCRMCKERRNRILKPTECAALSGADEAGCDKPPAAPRWTRRPRRDDATLRRNCNTRPLAVPGVFCIHKPFVWTAPLEQQSKLGISQRLFDRHQALDAAPSTAYALRACLPGY